MREVFEDAPIVREVPVQHRLTVVLIAAPQNVVMCSGNDLHSVQLHEAELFDDVIEVDRSGWLGGQA